MEMTKGPIVKTILKLALPIMASAFLATLYNICDMFWVGTLGAKTVAGVGVGGMFLWLSTGFATLPRMGGQVLTAQAIGAQNISLAKDYARASIHVILLFSLIFGGICLLCTDSLISFFNLTDGISRVVAYKYLRITCGLILFSFLNLTLTGLYTADGDSRTPMIANFTGLVLNMILDPILIIGPGCFPRLEAVGAAIATVFSQAVVTVILCFRMRSKKTKTIIFQNQNYFKLCKKEEYQQIFKIGTPAAIQSMVYCFISMILTRFISVFGAEALAVSRVGGQIESISWNTADGFAAAINSFCGQNYGAGKQDRIRKGYLFSAMTSFGWGILVLLVFLMFPAGISGIFFHEEKAILISIAYLTIVGLSQPFMMVELVTSGALSGLGRTTLSSIISVVFTGIRIPIALGLMHTGLALDGIWWTYTISSVLKGVLFCIAFFMVHRFEKKESL